ncbi:uncharacterized protein LOC110075047 isoform X1 [Pogona vitticeps]
MVLRQYFNIFQMAFLHIFPLVLLLLNTSNSIQAVSSSFSCESNVAERGKTASIICKYTKDIRNASVKFCFANTTTCPERSELNTYNRKLTSDHGRISLKLNHSAILIINKVQILDQRNYYFFLEAENHFGRKYVFLKVVATYTNPQVRRQNDTLICTATGGYPEKYLYWFDKYNTNLTDRSKFVAVPNADGSFSLNSTLLVDSSDSKMAYCCTFNNTNSFHEPQGGSCITFEDATTNELRLEKTNNSILIVVIVLVVLTVILLALFWRTKKGSNKICRRGDSIASTQQKFHRFLPGEQIPA